jgi:hypothetical protein
MRDETQAAAEADARRQNAYRIGRPRVRASFSIRRTGISRSSSAVIKRTRSTCWRS